MEGEFQPEQATTRTGKQGGQLKKILPWVGIAAGVGLVIVVLVKLMNSRSSTGANVSGIPAYDQYQSNYAPQPLTAEAVNQLGLAYHNAYPQVPHSVLKDGHNLYTECGEKCNGQVGCTDGSAANFNPRATCGCINCCVPKTYGCLDPNAASFNPFANTHDARFCTYATKAPVHNVAPVALDCSAQLQLNPDAAAAAGCVAPLGGCTDPNNAMFSPQATFNDGTCVYGGSAVAAAPRDSQFLGGLQGCGDSWTLSNANSLGATTY